MVFPWARILSSGLGEWGMGEMGEGLGSKVETVTGCLASLLLFPPPETQPLSLGCSDGL